MKEPLENFDYSNEPAFEGISKATAKDLADRYKTECQPLLAKQMPNSANNMDARSIVFPIEQLKKMIWEIESNVRTIPDAGELGIRMYYGKYPDIKAIKQDPHHPLHGDLSNLPDEYSFRHTLFLVPTFKDNNNVDWDFDPWLANRSNRLEPLDISSDDVFEQGCMTAQMNHGNICPPPFSEIDKDNRNEGLSF